MKKSLLLTTLLVVIISFTVSAANRPVNGKVWTSFTKQFAGVQEATWTKINETYLAKFLWQGKQLEAYFSEDGDVIGTGQFISTTNLPYIINNALKNRFETFAITQLYEFNSEKSGLQYFAIVATAQKSVIVEVDTYGVVSVLRKFKIPE
jgi:hypothetical protein